MACNALLYYASNEQPPSVCMDNWVQSELSPKITVLVEWNLCIKEMWSAIGNFKRLKVNQLNRTKCKNICTIHRATYLLEKRTIDTKNTVFIQLPNHTYKQEMFFPSIKHKHCVWLSTRSLELQLTLNKVLAIICESCPRTCSHPYLLSTPHSWVSLLSCFLLKPAGSSFLKTVPLVLEAFHTRCSSLVWIAPQCS